MQESDLAELLHENSKVRPEVGPVPGSAGGGAGLALELMDGSIKEYPSAPQVPLPDPVRPLGADLGLAICRRSAVREFAATPLAAAALAQLLWYGNGVREVARTHGYRNYRRNVPSAGNLGSVDLYPLLLQVAGVQPGLYHYHPVHHHLARLGPAPTGRALAHLLLQPELAGAGAILALGSSLARVRAKYGWRGYRYACMDAGHVGQNLCLVAAALGLGACPLGSFDDDRWNQLLGLDGTDEAVLYLVAVGAAKSSVADTAPQKVDIR